MRELELIYKKRKQQLLPLVMGFAAFFVIFRVILPQWTDIQEVRELLTTKENSVAAKEETLLLLNSISTEKVEEDYSIATTALPLQKDIVLIFTELNDASIRAGVDLGGFSVKVGDVYSTKKEVKVNERAINGVPYLNILVNISGPNENLIRFAEELYQSIPLVEIKTMDITKRDARYDVNFFFKPVLLRPLNAQTIALKALTAPENQQITTLKGWRSQTFELR